MNELIDFFTIGAVERDTGIGRDTLRVWERRYGFPCPDRNDKGERIYPEPQLRMLQRVRRLLDQGVRPGMVLPPEETNLSQLESRLSTTDTPGTSAGVADILKALSVSNTGKLKSLFEQIYNKQGLETFVLETVAPMLTTLGNRWCKGELRVVHEHIRWQ